MAPKPMRATSEGSWEPAVVGAGGLDSRMSVFPALVVLLVVCSCNSNPQNTQLPDPIELTASHRGHATLSIGVPQEIQNSTPGRLLSLQWGQCIVRQNRQRERFVRTRLVPYGSKRHRTLVRVYAGKY